MTAFWGVLTWLVCYLVTAAIRDSHRVDNGDGPKRIHGKRGAPYLAAP